MKKIFLLFTLLLISTFMLAQDTVKISLCDQYKRDVKNASVNINGVVYHTDKNGHLALVKPSSDSVTIKVEGYEGLTVSVSRLSSVDAIPLKKDFTWTDLLTPMFYILNGGLWLLLLIIFAETGLFVGFFFPGDSLLFVAGILSTPLVDSISLNTGNDFFNLLIISGLCIVAGILGNTVGYLTGRKVGPAMFNWRDRFLFKKKFE